MAERGTKGRDRNGMWSERRDDHRYHFVSKNPLAKYQRAFFHLPGLEPGIENEKDGRARQVAVLAYHVP